MIINRIKPELVEKKEMLDSQDVLNILGIELIGLIPEDPKVVSATNKGEPTIYLSSSPSGESYGRIARRILGENVAFVEPRSHTGFLGMFKRIFT